MPAIQSDRPEDTAAAREEGLTAEDFERDEDEERAGEPPARRCLTGEQILTAEDRGYLDNWVPTPEWGGPGSGVFVLTPSGEDRERYEQLTKIRRKQQGRRTVEVREMNFDELRERLTIDFACDEAGKLLFPCHNREQRRETIGRLKKKAAAPIGRIGDLVCHLMGWTQQNLDDMVGNSETGPS
jgi:hypothetical protein